MKVSPALYKQITWFLFLTRPIASLLIFVDPVLACILVYVMDSYDGTSASHGNMSRKLYDILDKIFDYLWYVVILIFVMVDPTYQQFAVPILALFLLRSAGEVMFMITRNRKFFVVFPNYLEWAFWLYVIGITFEATRFVVWNPIFMAVFLTIKLGFEYFMHWYDGDVAALIGLKLVWKE